MLHEHFQRPYQYLVQLADSTADLDLYTFKISDTVNDVKSILSVFLK